MNRIEELAILSRVILLRDERAFARLVEDYQERVRRFFLMQTGGDAMLSDDLAQETFLRVWQGLDTFRQAATFGTWIYRIAYRQWQDHCRTHPIQREPLPLDERTLSLPAQTDDELIQTERADRLCHALARMDEPARTCLTLFYLEELCVRSIARITQLEEPNIRQILSRGRKKLKAIYEHTEA